jgi:hypothetical protein
VDDFGVKYVGREHAEHVMTCIKKKYIISSDCNGTAYCGLTLYWDYNDRTVEFSMPGYIKAALQKYQHPAPERPEHSPRTKNRYHASDMILHIHSDASYLSESEAKSRAGGFFYMGNATKYQKKITNGAILIVSKVIKHVTSSAAEAEIGAVFINAKEGAVLRTTLEELWHTQPPPTPIETDNTTATGYINGTIKQKRRKSMDIRFYWIKDQVKQGQFKIYWGSGYQKLADYFSKHHSLAHHKRIRDIYIHADEQPINRKGIRDSALRGCVNTSGKSGSQIPQPPLGDDASPCGR